MKGNIRRKRLKKLLTRQSEILSKLVLPEDHSWKHGAKEKLLDRLEDCVDRIYAVGENPDPKSVDAVEIETVRRIMES